MDRAALHVLRRVLAIAVDVPPPQASLRLQPIRRLRRLHEFELKIAGAVSHADHARRQLLSRRHCGRGSLKGKEVAEMLNERNFPSLDVSLLDDDESIGKLEAAGTRSPSSKACAPNNLRNMDFTFFAADPECTRKNWKRARDAGSAIIDFPALWKTNLAPPCARSGSSASGTKCWHRSCSPAPCVVAHPAAVTSGVAAASCAAKRADCAARWLRCSSLPPNTGRRAWTSCISRPSICSRSSLCRRICSMRRWRSICLRATGRNRSCARFAGSSRAATLSENCRSGCAAACADCCFSRPFFTGMRSRCFLEMEQAVDQSDCCRPWLEIT